VIDDQSLETVYWSYKQELKNDHTRQPKVEDETTTLPQNVRHLSPWDAATYPGQKFQLHDAKV